MEDRTQTLIEMVVGIAFLTILTILTFLALAALDTDGTIVGHGWDGLIGLGVGSVIVLIGGGIYTWLTIRRLQRDNDRVYAPMIAYWTTTTWCEGCQMEHVGDPCPIIDS